MFREADAASTGGTTPATFSRPPAGAPRDLVAVMLSAAEKLQHQPWLNSARALLARSGEQLCALLEADRRPDWAWFEIVFEEDACRLPEALLRAGRVLGRDDFMTSGIDTLDWMLRGRILAKCADTLASACDAAFAATGDLKWLMIARTAIPGRPVLRLGN